MIKIGITGANGMLGYDLSNLLARKNNYEVHLFDLPKFDITNKNNLEKIVHSSDIIINCAAYTAVDNAETDSNRCYAVNAAATEILGKLAAKFKKYLIHVSTDFVFGDNSSEPLTEMSKTNPLSVYGQSKLEGEQLLSNTTAKSSIIRVQWTYGKHGNNFISKILTLADKFDSLNVVNDQFGSPTHTIDAAKAILCFIKKQPEGLFHFASKDYTSRYETAKLICRTLKIKTEIKPCTSDKFPTPASRPKNSRFDCSKIDAILDFKRPLWQDSLKTFLLKNYF